MPVIKDFEGYLKRMQNGMDDKLWWVDKVDSKIIVDYGCADGTLLKHIRELHPDYTLVGVDVLPEMLERAYKNVPDAHFITKKVSKECSYRLRCEMNLLATFSNICCIKLRPKICI
jgi:trans-aconitate methyltransferase